MTKTVEATKPEMVQVQVGQILKETHWAKGFHPPFIHHTRVDAIVRVLENYADICGPGDTTPEGIPLYKKIFGSVNPEGGVGVEKTIPDEWGGVTVREVIPLGQLPDGLIWSDAIRKDYAGLGPWNK